MQIFLKKFPSKSKVGLFTIFLFATSIVLFKNMPIEIKDLLLLATAVIKQVFSLLLPFIILPFIVNGILSIGIQGTYLFATIIITVIISNFVAIMIPYLLGIHIIPKLNFNDISLYLQDANSLSITEIGINIPTLIGIEKTVLLSTLVGFLLHFCKTKKLYLISYIFEKYYKLTTLFLYKIFTPLLPLYALGTILDVYSRIDAFIILSIFGQIILLIMLVQISYIALLFFIGSQGKIKETVRFIKNSIEPTVVGFFTMSSIATLPITLKAAENNTQDSETSRIIITTTVNCHDIGDSISLPMIALIIFYIFNISFPGFMDYFYFSFTLAIVQFGGLSIPGGSCIIIIPLLMEYFNFNSEMTNLLIAIAILIEPLGTAGNVMGNNAFVILVRKVYLTIITSFKT